MAANNNIVLIGRVTKDPELRKINSKRGDMSATSFTLAVDNKSRADAETDFFACSLIGAQADTFCKYVVKGRMIAVCGDIHYRKWTSKDGVEHKDVQVSATSYQLLDSNRGGNQASTTSAPQQRQTVANPVQTVEYEDDDDLPF